MVDNKSEIVPKSVEEIFKDSKNPTLRGYSERITDLREDLDNRLLKVEVKLVLLPLCLTGVGLNLLNLMHSNDLKYIALGFGLALPSGLLIHHVGQDTNKMALARGEISSLTTVLAAEALAQSKEAN